MIFPKLIFCDWMGTLVSHKMLSNYFLSRIKSIKKTPVDSSNLSFEEIFILKKMKEEQGDCFIPYSWHLVKKFHSLGAKIIIVSNGCSKEIKRCIKFAPFQEFSLILGTDKFLPKPNKEMFEYGLKEMRCSREESILIGDSSTDKVAADNMQIKYYEINDTFQANFKVAKHFEIID